MAKYTNKNKTPYKGKNKYGGGTDRSNNARLSAKKQQEPEDYREELDNITPI